MPDSEAVMVWRDFFKYNLAPAYKRDIDNTVTDIELWKYTVSNWGYWKAGKWISFNPFQIGHLLAEYERLERKGKTDTYSYVQEVAYERYRKERDVQTWRD